MSPLGQGSASDGGPVAPDGSPVGLYRAFPAGREPEIIHGAVPPAASILELGCGAGRITHELTALGHHVVAVDQSAEMLAHVHTGTRVHADIEALALTERFPAVVLASYLVNTIVPGQRDAFLKTCHRHVADGGIVLVQRTSPTWATGLKVGHTVRSDRMVLTVTEARLESGVLYAAQECRHGDTTWTHAWTDVVYSDREFEEVVEAAGFALMRWLDEDREWAALQPLPR
ncbi:class I SAM-dependent methyltransferase [Streptomyces sp. NPDC047097]|uniref:class I SAM-dependent methyltransferase n=1 Tax=Streptomyces sp. NPDC047097 TaxID=3155260 RepID=UPI0033F65F16